MTKWAPGITALRWASGHELKRLGQSPAAVYRATGVVLMNPRFRYRLTASEWYFILLHEAGHLALQTSDEKAVDEWAFREFAKRGHSLRSSVKALVHAFPFTTGEQYERASLQLQRAQEFDQKNTRPKRRIILQDRGR